MAGEQSTVARPYAEAVFKRAVQTGALDAWSETLSFLSQLVTDPLLSDLLDDPRLGAKQLAEFVVGLAPKRLGAEARNLVRLLAENGRLQVVPEIVQLFEQRRHEHQGTLEVEVISAFPVDAAQQAELAAALKRRLGREISVTSVQDPRLIGGVTIRAGDLVIDGSLRGQLGRLATELGI